MGGSTLPMVIDGDGLVALEQDPATVLEHRSAGAAPVVLTPHEGEFAALTGGPPDVDRFASVRALAAQTGAVVLLKGPVTLVKASSSPI